ncbi:type II toxin-antitoxin system RelE/ParE family toxin [Rhizobium sp. CC-YZS058]|uniref:type II toxin-antitoxin system RelE/ParE family toxin n=1 Tax=Rhizobium sp. CC-YZS058 TaxID=3042153 RepID=UPI003A4C567F
MKVRFTRRARLSVRQIISSIAESSPSGAEAVSKRIERAAYLLEDFHRVGVGTNLPQIRKMTLNPYPYLLFYTVGKSGVSILEVRHAARRPLTWKEERH